MILLYQAFGHTGKEFLKVKAKVLLHDVDVVELQVAILIIAKWHDANVV